MSLSVVTYVHVICVYDLLVRDACGWRRFVSWRCVCGGFGSCDVVECATLLIRDDDPRVVFVSVVAHVHVICLCDSLKCET